MAEKQSRGKEPQQERIRVFIEDHTGNQRREAKVAADAPISELVPAMITALKLPATDPTGRPVSYHLAFGDRQMQGEETLSSAGVVEGANITLVPELTAGWRR